MHKIDTSTAVDGNFVDPVPAQGGLGTVVDADWLNAVQNEICNAITATGITLSKTANNQLLSALQLFADNASHRTALPSTLAYDDQTSTTSQDIGDAVAITYTNTGWLLSASIFVSITTPSSSGTITFSVDYVVNNEVHTLATKTVDSSFIHAENLSVDLNVPYAAGSLEFSFVATENCTVDVQVSGFTAKM